MCKEQAEPGSQHLRHGSSYVSVFQKLLTLGIELIKSLLHILSYHLFWNELLEGNIAFIQEPFEMQLQLDNSPHAI